VLVLLSADCQVVLCVLWIKPYQLEKLASCKHSYQIFVRQEKKQSFKTLTRELSARFPAWATSTRAMKALRYFVSPCTHNLRPTKFFHSSFPHMIQYFLLLDKMTSRRIEIAPRKRVILIRVILIFKDKKISNV
jgi:hypothetical protein